MALSTLGPFNLPPLNGVGFAFTIIKSGQFSGPNIAGQVLLTNNSGYIISLTSSSQGNLPNLNPGMVAAIDVPQGGGSLTAEIVGGTPTVLNPQVTAQLGVDGDTFSGDTATFPGAYPFTIPLTGYGFPFLGKDTSGSSQLTPGLALSGSQRGLIIISQSPPILPPAGYGPYIPIDQGAVLLETSAAPGSTFGTWFLMAAGLLTIQVEFNNPTQWFINESDVDFDFPGLRDDQPSGVVALGSQSLGADWSYQLPWPMRLVGVSAQLNTAAGGGTRYPYLWMNVGSLGVLQLPMSTAGLTGGTALIMNGFIAAGAPFQRSGDNRCSFPIPADIYLPYFSIVESATGSIAGGDQWVNVILFFNG